MAAPKFLERIARLPAVMTLLAAYPEGLRLVDLATTLEVDEETLRQDLLTYLDLESWGWSFDLFRRPAIEFLQLEEGSDDVDGTVVRIVPDAAPGLGVDFLSPGELAVLYTAGMALRDAAQDDADLEGALGVIAETMYGQDVRAPSVGAWVQFVPELQEAQERCRRVRIVYSRAWRQGVTERVIEPLRLMQTKRGWEVDAGPVGPEGALRTFLLTNIRSLEVLDEQFDVPAGVERLLERQRRTTTVRLEIAQDARWAARQYAERFTSVQEDDETFVADLELLPPVGERVGLIMLASGDETRVVSPPSVLPEALQMIEELLDHHLHA